MKRRHLAARMIRATFAAAWQSVVTWVVIATTIAAVIALVASQFATVNALRQRNFQLGEQGTQASQRYDRLFAEYSKLYDESKDKGVEPSTADPSNIPDTTTSGGTAGATGATGAAGARGPQGDMGVPGQTGAGGSAGADGKPGATGAAGSDGTDGTAGSPGTTGDTGATGAQGVTGPQGATGPAGTNGTNGSDGRGVASVTCVASDAGTAFRFTFTDSTTTDVAGTCVPAVTPTDPATPAE